MARTLLLRGMLVGVVAAVAAFLVAQAFGESPLGAALAFDSARKAATGVRDLQLVSRATQSTIGLFTGLVGFAVALGGTFAVAYACVQGRLGTLGARSTAALVALAGFIGLYLIPDLKYPANPPPIGNPDTIGWRTALYFTMMAISLAVVIGAPLVARRLAARFGGWNAALLAAAGSLIVIAAAYLLLPGVHETPAGFPADVLWRFRIASAAIQATVWATLGLLFGVLTERHLRAVTITNQPHPAPPAPRCAPGRDSQPGHAISLTRIGPKRRLKVPETVPPNTSFLARQRSHHGGYHWSAARTTAAGRRRADRHRGDPPARPAKPTGRNLLPGCFTSSGRSPPRCWPPP